MAYDLMLQEDWSHPINRMLAWYACHLRLQHLRETGGLGEEEEEEKEEEEGEEEEEEEEVSGGRPTYTLAICGMYSLAAGLLLCVSNILINVPFLHFQKICALY